MKCRATTRGSDYVLNTFDRQEDRSKLNSLHCQPTFPYINIDRGDALSCRW